MKRTIFLLFLGLFSISAQATITGNPPVNLQHAYDYRSLNCGTEEECFTKRIHKCTNTTNPHISCGSVIWKEELIGCHTCPQGVWQDGSTWSKCDGTGCSDTVQSFERTCANKAVNLNCKLIQTRFCQQKSICNGTWSSWTSDSPECKDQCGISRLRVMQRTCMKHGKPKSSCEIPKASTPLVDTYIDHCRTTPCQTTTETTTVATTTATETATTTKAATTTATEAITTTKAAITTTKAATTTTTEPITTTTEAVTTATEAITTTKVATTTSTEPITTIKVATTTSTEPITTTKVATTTSTEPITTTKAATTTSTEPITTTKVATTTSTGPITTTTAATTTAAKPITITTAATTTATKPITEDTTTYTEATPTTTEACITTTEATTTTTVATTMTTATMSPVTFLSSWSKWEACTATCKSKEGIEKRSRKCMNQDNKETTVVSCPGEMLTEERKCNFANVQKCKEENLNASTTTTPQEITTGTTDMTGVEKKSVIEEKGFKEKPNIVTKTSFNVTSIREQTSLKREHKIVIIVLVTTGSLIFIVIIVYVFYFKKNKERGRQRRKIGTISVVGLQSHTGYMRGMEAYGFTNSTVPTGDIFSAVNPAAAATEIRTVQEREPPQLSPGPSMQVNQNSTHIYEDMRFTGTEEASNVTAPARRSLSYHDKICRNTSLVPDADWIQARRRSCFETGESQRQRSAPPPKPPRRLSLINRNKENNISHEMKEVPKCLYNSKDRAPDLGFINNIYPPAWSPPVTPLDSNQMSLTLPKLATQSRSAPVSPNHPQFSPQMPQSPYVACAPPNSIIFPYGGVPYMAPVQYGGVMYMAVSPLYPPSQTYQMGHTIQATALHGAEVILRNKCQKPLKQRPKTVSFPPQISISEASSNLLSPHGVAKSPVLNEYAEMCHLMSPSVPPDFEDADSVMARSKSFKYLHGTHNMSPSHITTHDENSNELLIPGPVTPEDSEGYLLSN